MGGKGCPMSLKMIVAVAVLAITVVVVVARVQNVLKLTTGGRSSDRDNWGYQGSISAA